MIKILAEDSTIHGQEGHSWVLAKYAGSCALDHLTVYNERGRLNLKICLADFVYLIQEPCRGHCDSLVFKSCIIDNNKLLNQISKICQAEFKFILFSL